MTAIRETTRVRADRTTAIPTPALHPGEQAKVIVLPGADGAVTAPSPAGRRLKAD